MCEEYESLHDSSGRPDKDNQLCSEKSRQKFLWRIMIQHIKTFYEERIEKLSQQDGLSKFCMDAGFLSVVEIGQCFMTKDTGDLTQFHAVALS